LQVLLATAKVLVKDATVFYKTKNVTTKKYKKGITINKLIFSKMFHFCSTNIFNIPYKQILNPPLWSALSSVSILKN